jgi:hypothetical protein
MRVALPSRNFTAILRIENLRISAFRDMSFRADSEKSPKAANATTAS